METVKSEIATFFDVFPDGSIFANELNGGGYDLVMLGWAGPARIDVDAVEGRLEQPAYQAVAQSLREVGFSSAIQMLGTYAGQASGPAGPGWRTPRSTATAICACNTCRASRLNNSQEGEIYSRMLTYRRYPENLFVVSDRLKADLMAAFASHGE